MKQSNSLARELLILTGRSLCASLFVWILRILLLATLAAGTTLYLNWEGPLTLSNGQIMAEKLARKAVHHIHDARVRMAPHVEDVQKQWSHLCHFLVQKTVHHGETLRQHFHVVWPIVKNRCYELSTVIGDNVMNCWQVVCREAPVYYELIAQKVNEFFKWWFLIISILFHILKQKQNKNKTKYRTWEMSNVSILILFFSIWNCLLGWAPPWKKKKPTKQEKERKKEGKTKTEIKEILFMYGLQWRCASNNLNLSSFPPTSLSFHNHFIYIFFLKFGCRYWITK